MTEHRKLLSAWGLAAKMAAMGFEPMLTSTRYDIYSGSRSQQSLNAKWLQSTRRYGFESPIRSHFCEHTPRL